MRSPVEKHIHSVTANANSTLGFVQVWICRGVGLVRSPRQMVDLPTESQKYRVT